MVQDTSYIPVGQQCLNSPQDVGASGQVSWGGRGEIWSVSGESYRVERDVIWRLLDFVVKDVVTVVRERAALRMYFVGEQEQKDGPSQYLKLTRG